jgi:small conductance mechanosensitive channel
MTQGQRLDLGALLASLEGIWNGFLAQIPFLLIGLVVFAAFAILARMVRRLIIAAGERTRVQESLALLLGRLAYSAVIVLGLFMAAVVVFPDFKAGDLITGLGISSVAIGFAFKDILQNFFAGVLLLWRQPFVVGDQIRSGDFEGTVEQIDVRSTRLRTYDGERVVLPNGQVYMNAILVRTAYDKRRVKFTVGVGYPDSIEHARSVLEGVLTRTEGVLPEPGPWIYVSELAPSSVNFVVYFWVSSEQANVLRVSDRVATGIKLALDEAKIDMPFPHRVVLLRQAPLEAEEAEAG